MFQKEKNVIFKQTVGENFLKWGESSDLENVRSKINKIKPTLDRP